MNPLMRRRSRDKAWKLRNWEGASRFTLTTASSTVADLERAAASGQRVFIRYMGGSTPGGGTRWIHPRNLFGVSGYGGYVRAYCEKRQEERTFSIDKISILPDADGSSLSRTHPPGAFPSTAEERRYYCVGLGFWGSNSFLDYLKTLK